MLSYDRYVTPRTLQAALEIISTLPEDGKVVSGGTDLLPWARDGRAGDVHFSMLVDVSRVDEFAGYRLVGDRVRLNAGIVFQDFLRDRQLRELLPCMPFCSVWFADDQIREQATLVGNLVNASPAADGTPPLLAMNAEIELSRLDGAQIRTRVLPLEDFVTGPGVMALRPGELVSAVICDAMRGYGGSFQKVGQRRSLVISKVAAVALVRINAAGDTFEDVRLALGGIGPVPVRLRDIEAMLIGQSVTRRLVAEASIVPAERVASRSMVAYRRRVVSSFVEAALEDALVSCGAPMPGEIDRENAHA